MARPAGEVAGRILLEHDEDRGARIARLSIDRPERLNALSTRLLDELASHLDALDAIDDLRLLVVRGAGERAFIGGADVDEMAELDETAAEVFIRRIHGVCQRLRRLRLPVVAAIDGYCLGAGLEVALSCDLRLATARSTLGVPEVRLGVPTVIEGALLKHFLGAGRARDLVLTGRSLSAEEALGWGLIDRLAPAEQLEAALEELMRELLAASPGALRLQKELCRVWEEAPLVEAVEAGVRAFSAGYRSGEPRSAMRRFIERPRRRDA